MTYLIGPTNYDVLMPDPEPEVVRYTVISVDDHLVEPPDMFVGRLPKHLQHAAPQLVENAKGHQIWEFDNRQFSQVGLNAVAGRKRCWRGRRGMWSLLNPIVPARPGRDG